jgi:hypothetical protein
MRVIRIATRLTFLTALAAGLAGCAQVRTTPELHFAEPAEVGMSG